MKKIISLLLMLVFVLSVAAIPVTAATVFEPVEFTVYADLPRGKEVLEAGDVIEVAVEVDPSKYIVGGQFALLYDPDVFILTDSIGGSGVTAAVNEKTPGVLSTGVATAGTVRTEVVVYEFKVKDNPKAGKTNFEWRVEEFRVDDGSAEGAIYTDDVTIENASVTVKHLSTTTTFTAGTDIKMNVTISDCPASGVLYAAVYKDHKLMACGREAFTSAITSKEFVFDLVEFDEAKVFLWNENGKPIIDVPEEVSID